SLSLHLFLSSLLFYFIFFFFNDTATTEIYTLSLHDALPISYLPYHYAFGVDPLRPTEPDLAEAFRLMELLREIGIRFVNLMPISDRKSTRLNSSHVAISYAVFCLKKKKKIKKRITNTKLVLK